jgi:hypothetical protein
LPETARSTFPTMLSTLSAKPLWSKEVLSMFGGRSELYPIGFRLQVFAWRLEIPLGQNYHHEYRLRRIAAPATPDA